jgi:hypothetical protein
MKENLDQIVGVPKHSTVGSRLISKHKNVIETKKRTYNSTNVSQIRS